MDRKPLPLSLLVMAVVAGLFGVGLAILILSGSNPNAQGLITALPTSSRGLLRQGAPAPDFTLDRLGGGESVKLSSLRGKPVMINFWASWCPPCLEETPALIEAYKQLKGENLDVEFVGIGTNDESANLQKFADNNKVPYTLVEDPDGKVSDAYGVLGMPTTVFLDGNGVVQRVWNGAIRKEQVVEIVRGLR